MPRRYPVEFRRKVLDLIEAGRPIVEIAAQLGVSDQTVYNWRAQDQIDRGLRAGVSTSILGHSSASSHEDRARPSLRRLDVLADRLDAVARTSRGLRLAPTEKRSTNMPSDQHEREWARLGSNQRPRDYESPALTTELRARTDSSRSSHRVPGFIESPVIDAEVGVRGGRARARRTRRAARRPRSD